MTKQQILIINRLGLHARAAAKLVSTASRFTGKTRIGRAGGDKLVDAKSIMAVMMLAASKGTLVDLETDGEDEAEAMAALVDLINDRFGEDE